MKKPSFFALSETGAKTLRAVSAAMGGKLVAIEGRVDQADCHVTSISNAIRAAFQDGEPVVAAMAAGSLIRILAPHFNDKQSEPAVVSVSEDGSMVVPLTGGHRGANDLARAVAQSTGGQAAITTAGDLRFGIALDAPPDGWTLANPVNAKSAMARLLAGETARLTGDAAILGDWLTNSRMSLSEDGTIDIRLTVGRDGSKAADGSLCYVPAVHVLGVGCERGCDPIEMITLVESVLEEANIAPQSIALVASIGVKADEAAVNAVAEKFGVPARFFEASRLEAETPRLLNPSEVVFAEVGCHGVAEAAALAASGDDAMLIIGKQKSRRSTVAVARSPIPLTQEKIVSAGSARGTLFVVGIGPGKSGWRSPEVTRMIETASDLVGYSLYLDLIEELCIGKTRHDFDLGREEDRVRHAMELAGKGKSVALVCSGDAGIYAMASLVFELLADGGLSDAAQRISIAVSPGISALQAAAAKAGAPLGHDFCTISLSDLLTPWEVIQRRVRAAAEGDFVIAFYNPVSKRRRTQLAFARDVLLEHRPSDTPVILATNLGRKEERMRVVPLADLQVDDVDMLTVVLVGSSDTRTVRTGDGKTWVYTPRGYSEKKGTGIVPARKAS